MKKAVNIFLLVFYLLFTIGVTTSATFCGTEAQNVSVTVGLHSSGSDCACNCCGGCESTCCTTEISTKKIDDSQNIYSINQSNQNIVTLIESDNLIEKNISLVSPKFNSNKGIYNNEQKAYLENSSFLI
jgi:hypothetical protein